MWLLFPVNAQLSLMKLKTFPPLRLRSCSGFYSRLFSHCSKQRLTVCRGPSPQKICIKFRVRSDSNFYPDLLIPASCPVIGWSLPTWPTSSSPVRSSHQTISTGSLTTQQRCRRPSPLRSWSRSRPGRNIALLWQPKSRISMKSS